jgi:hypothetical protein
METEKQRVHLLDKGTDGTMKTIDEIKLLGIPN